MVGTGYTVLCEGPVVRGSACVAQGRALGGAVPRSHLVLTVVTVHCPAGIGIFASLTIITRHGPARVDVFASLTIITRHGPTRVDVSALLTIITRHRPHRVDVSASLTIVATAEPGRRVLPRNATDGRLLARNEAGEKGAVGWRGLGLPGAAALATRAITPGRAGGTENRARKINVRTRWAGWGSVE